jgi:hypothetical protein
VLVSSEDGGKVIRYEEPAKALPGIGKAEYEAKALELVKARLAETQR